MLCIVLIEHVLADIWNVSSGVGLALLTLSHRIYCILSITNREIYFVVLNPKCFLPVLQKAGKVFRDIDFILGANFTLRESCAYEIRRKIVSQCFRAPILSVAIPIG